MGKFTNSLYALTIYLGHRLRGLTGMLESKYVKQQLLQAQVSTTPANIFTKPPRCSHMSNPSTLYPNVVTYKRDGSYTGHMQPGGHRTNISATYRQFQSLDRQLGSSVTWELQNKANILLRAQQIWNDSVTLLVMYKHQNAINIKPMLLGAAPLGHQQLYLMGNSVMIPQ